MKKITALFLAVIMLAAMAACGGKEQKDPADSGKETNAVSTGEDTVATIDGDTLNAKLWTLIYDGDVWKYDEEDLYDEDDESSVEVFIPDGEDGYLISVEISAEIDDPYDFRDDLVYYGFDEYEYAVKNTYKTVDVAGCAMLKYDGESWGEPYTVYFNRVENAGATVEVRVNGDVTDARVKALLAGLKFNLKDSGNEDGPWYWEGTPFTSGSANESIGTYSVESEWIPFEECVRTRETFDHAVAVSGDKVYIISDGVLKLYSFDGKKLTYEKDIELDAEYDSIQATSDGTVWVSAFMEPLLGLKDGEVSVTYEGTETVSMHPSGEWGVSWFSGPECSIITRTGDSFTKAPIKFSAVDTISHLNVSENYIFVCGSDVEDECHKVFVYKKDGTLVKTLCDEKGEGLGSVTFMAETVNGFFGLDGNMRDIILWSTDGEYQGDISDGDLFGTGYPWFCGGAMLEDGSIFAVMTDDRADESAKELVVFKITVK